MPQVIEQSLFLYFPPRAATKRPLIIPPPSPHLYDPFPQKIKGKTSTLAPLFLPRRLPWGRDEELQKKEKTRERGCWGKKKKTRTKLTQKVTCHSAFQAKKASQVTPSHKSDNKESLSMTMTTVRKEEGIVEKSPHFLRRRGSFSFRQMGAVSLPLLTSPFPPPPHIVNSPKGSKK